MFSKQYIDQLVSIHGNVKKKKGFGGKLKDLGEFENFLVEWNPKNLIDYGCGKGAILSDLQSRYKNIQMEGYDPAVHMFKELPNKTYECVFSNDVLEHIEPAYINDVLTHINNLSTKYIWLRIDTKPARKVLPDGRNAHLIIEDIKWWEQKILSFIDGKIVYKHTTDKMRVDFAIDKTIH